MEQILQFTKMHGLGNDFILMDATSDKINLKPAIIRQLANRRTGIGFDQLLVVERSLDKQYDFVYRIFNADGSEVEQCGNGARCVAHYLFTRGLTKKKQLVLATQKNPIELYQEKDGLITVNMGIADFDPKQLPFLTNQQSPTYSLELENQIVTFGAVSVGNPHVVLTVADTSQAPVEKIGELFQTHPSFPKQVNVGFMQVISPSHIKLRVFERGVGETLACGSGACAAVAIGRSNNMLDNRVTVELPGGSLIIRLESVQDPIYMTGPAVEVFTGYLRLIS